MLGPAPTALGPANPVHTVSRQTSIVLALLCLAWILPGLVGHEPWKPDEAYTFGLVLSMIQSGDWVVPTLAGEPFMEKPPIFFQSAALAATLLSPPLALHDAARLAVGLWNAATLALVAWAARGLYGKGYPWVAAIVLLGCLGMLVRTHQMITDVALLTGFAAALAGLAWCLARPVLGGILLGTGVGIGFMSKGLLAPGIVGVTALLLLAFRPWRCRAYFLALGVALLASLPWLTVWPLLLWQRSPELFMEWFWTNNFGRFFGTVRLGPEAEPAYYLKNLPWFAWPALPLALWTLWKRGLRALLAEPGLHLPLTAFLVMLGVLSVAADARELYALPMLLPLALLAAGGVDSLPRAASSALDWFAIMTFGLSVGLLWLGWTALLTGHPAALAARLERFVPGYGIGFSASSFALALFTTAAWVALMWRTGRGNRRSIINWAGGITAVWMLLMTLWLPWLDLSKSYKEMMLSMGRAMPADTACVSSQALGEPQRAMLHYYLGLPIQRLGGGAGASCEVLLVQAGWRDPEQPQPGWTRIWEGSRPGDANEVFRLYRRGGP